MSRKRRKGCDPVRIESLARHSVRPEVVLTPGPTKYNVPNNPFEARKIPCTFRKTKRMPYGQPTPSVVDRPITHDSKGYEYIQPKSFSATFNNEPRFGWKRRPDEWKLSGPTDTSKSWKFTQPKPYSANFNLTVSKKAYPKDPLLLKGTLGPAPGYYTSDIGTIMHTVRNTDGGAISQEPRSMEWAIHQESPGPIYYPNFSLVEPRGAVAPFSKYPRKLGWETKDSVPGPLTYADGAMKAESSLSTVPRSPATVFSTRPSAAEMPLPFTVETFCNSGTMRICLPGPAGAAAREEVMEQKAKRAAYWEKKLAKARPRRPVSAPTKMSILSQGRRKPRPASAASHMSPPALDGAGEEVDKEVSDVKAREEALQHEAAVKQARKAAKEAIIAAERGVDMSPTKEKHDEKGTQLELTDTLEERLHSMYEALNTKLYQLEVAGASITQTLASVKLNSCVLHASATIHQERSTSAGPNASKWRWGGFEHWKLHMVGKAIGKGRVEEGTVDEEASTPSQSPSSYVESVAKPEKDTEPEELPQPHWQSSQGPLVARRETLRQRVMKKLSGTQV